MTAPEVPAKTEEAAKPMATPETKPATMPGTEEKPMVKPEEAMPSAGEQQAQAPAVEVEQKGQ